MTPKKKDEENKENIHFSFSELPNYELSTSSLIIYYK